MKSDAHIANAAEPLKQFSTIKSVCGTEVLNAEFVRVWQMQKIRPTLDDPEWHGICRKCIKRCMATPLEENIVYLIRNGQEILAEGEL